MAELIDHAKFLYVIKRKTPCIISIQNSKDSINRHIHNSLEILSKQFPFVLYYKLNINDYIRYQSNSSIYGPNNVISFKERKIKNVINGTNNEDLYKLFWNVYYDSCTNHVDKVIKILIVENRIPKYLTPPCVTKEELDILNDHVDEIINKFIYLPNVQYPPLKLVFGKKKNYNFFYVPKIKNLKKID